ncbi:MAG: hypothetical protein LBQ12_01955 [Deltaproteobacteria bacterium]|jgi:hypothetical protein|nr:hypothetical protein [Deltaproteobacteria bacterium]
MSGFQAQPEHNIANGTIDIVIKSPHFGYTVTELKYSKQDNKIDIGGVSVAASQSCALQPPAPKKFLSRALGEGSSLGEFRYHIWTNVLSKFGQLKASDFGQNFGGKKHYGGLPGGARASQQSNSHSLLPPFLFPLLPLSHPPPYPHSSLYLTLPPPTPPAPPSTT